MSIFNLAWILTFFLCANTTLAQLRGRSGQFWNCNSLLIKTEKKTPPNYVQGSETLLKLQPEDFFSQDFLDQIKANDDELLATISANAKNPYEMQFEFITRQGHGVAHFKLVVPKDTKREAIIMHDLILVSPPYLEKSSSYHQGRFEKGLPASEGRHFYRALSEILVGVGYDWIRIDASSDFTAQTLYHKLLGAQANTNQGRKILEYLEDIYKTADWSAFLGHSVSLDEFSEMLGRLGSDDTGLYVARPPARSTLEHPIWGTIAEWRDNQVHILFPFLDPVRMSWSKLYEEYDYDLILWIPLKK